MWQVPGCVHRASVCRGQALCPWWPCPSEAPTPRGSGTLRARTEAFIPSVRRSSADRPGTSNASV